MLRNSVTNSSLNLFSAAFFLSLATIAPAQADKAFEGAHVKVGNGEAYTLIRTGADDQPSSISVIFTPGMLDKLPEPAPGSPPDIPFSLPMPANGPKMVVDHVVINWEAHGHQPAHVYDVPHFDFHFYLVSEAAQNSVAFKDEKESGDPSQQPPPELLSAGYIVPPGTAVPKMGVHAVNPASAEFKGKPFDATFIFGYYKKELTFIEPMVSVKFLKSKPTFTAEIPQPRKFSISGRYPTAYDVKYDAKASLYEVGLRDFK